MLLKLNLYVISLGDHSVKLMDHKVCQKIMKLTTWKIIVIFIFYNSFQNVNTSHLMHLPTRLTTYVKIQEKTYFRSLKIKLYNVYWIYLNSVN